jgi:hypothetical protein
MERALVNILSYSISISEESKMGWVPLLSKPFKKKKR